VVSHKGDAATSATKRVARTVSPPRETDGGIFMSKRKSSTSTTSSSEVTTNLIEYDGDLSKLNGELLAGWFGASAMAEHSGLFRELRNSGKYESLTDTLNFFENANKPLLPGEISEPYVRNYMKL
jgi:hypothetical protein